MNFARSQLEKYGWTVGKGLGPREDGIAVALKPTLKRSKTGLGHDLANEHTDHWWTKLYNKAADNVVVKSGEAGEDISTKEDNSFNIASETWKITHNKQPEDNKGKYANHFVKKAILTNNKTEGVTDSESSSDDDVPAKDVFKMTDEELFAACGGRTAHKAARHGIRATGKLSRIEEQEKQLLSNPKFEGYSHAKLAKKSNTLPDVEIKALTSIDNDDNVIMTKKKKKRKCIAELGEAETPNQRNSDDTVRKKKKDKRKCNADLNEAEVLDLVDGEVNTGVLKNKKDKRKCNPDFYEPEELNLLDENKNSNMIKKKKKRKTGNTESEKIETLNLVNYNGDKNVTKIRKSNPVIHEAETLNSENICLIKIKNNARKSNSDLDKVETPDLLECDESTTGMKKKKTKTKHSCEINKSISESVSVHVEDGSNKSNNKNKEDAKPVMEVEDKETRKDEAAVTAKKKKKKKHNGDK